jgi:hypothetical protein
MEGSMHREGREHARDQRGEGACARTCMKDEYVFWSSILPPQAAHTADVSF